VTEVVYTRDLSSGRIHRRFTTPSGSLASLEADNLDDAGEYEVITPDALSDVEPEKLCARCFPEDAG
jgi:hypothetical protein